MKFLMRSLCYSYGGDEGPGEHEHVGYVTVDGSVTQVQAQARRYESEAEAWEHATAAGLVGRKEDGSPWCWVEEEKS